MRFHPKAFFRALVILSAFGTLLQLGMDPTLGIIAILAVTVVDALSFLLPLGMGIGGGDSNRGKRNDDRSPDRLHADVR
jgi:hypothetical protein